MLCRMCIDEWAGKGQHHDDRGLQYGWTCHNPLQMFLMMHEVAFSADFSLLVVATFCVRMRAGMPRLDVDLLW